MHMVYKLVAVVVEVHMQLPYMGVVVVAVVGTLAYRVVVVEVVVEVVAFDMIRSKLENTKVSTWRDMAWDMLQDVVLEQALVEEDNLVLAHILVFLPIFLLQDELELVLVEVEPCNNLVNMQVHM